MTGAGVTRAPWVTWWTGEIPGREAELIIRGGGLDYVDPRPDDRDDWGVLWGRLEGRPGTGEPDNTSMHPRRQRDAAIRALCQVGGGQASWTATGLLFVLPTPPDADGAWYEGLRISAPPVCVPHAREAVRRCPRLREGYTAFRARSTKAYGPSGVVYRWTSEGPRPWADTTLPFSSALVRWMLASQMVFTVNGCVAVDLAAEDDHQRCVATRVPEPPPRREARHH